MKRKNIVIIFIALFIVSSVLTIGITMVTEFANDSNAPAMEITGIEYVGTNEYDEREYKITLLNSGNSSCSYPIIEISNDYFDMEIFSSDSMYPDDYYGIIEIPPGEETWGIYTIDEYAYEELAGEECTVVIEDSSVDVICTYEF